MKATEQYFPVVLFIMLYKVVLTFESVGEILKCDHSEGLKVSMPQPFASKFIELETRKDSGL